MAEFALGVCITVCVVIASVSIFYKDPLKIAQESYTMCINSGTSQETCLKYLLPKEK